MSERLTPWTIAEGLGKYARTDELLTLRARVAKLEAALELVEDAQDALRLHGWGMEVDAVLAVLKDAPQ